MMASLNVAGPHGLPLQQPAAAGEALLEGARPATPGVPPVDELKGRLDALVGLVRGTARPDLSEQAFCALEEAFFTEGWRTCRLSFRGCGWGRSPRRCCTTGPASRPCSLPSRRSGGGPLTRTLGCAGWQLALRPLLGDRLAESPECRHSWPSLPWRRRKMFLFAGARTSPTCSSGGQRLFGSTGNFVWRGSFQ